MDSVGSWLRRVGLLLVAVAMVAGCASVVDGEPEAAQAPAVPRGPEVAGSSVGLAPGEDTEVQVSPSWAVTLPDGSAPSGAEFTVEPIEGELSPEAFSGAALTLTSGQPQVPLTFTYTFAEPVPEGVEVLLLGTPGDGPSDEPVETTAITAELDTARLTASAQVPHLSFWEWVATDVNNFITSAAGLRTDAPECESQPRPGWFEDAIFLDGKEAPMLVCTGSDPNDSSVGVVKIRNNRGVAMIITAPVTPAWAHHTVFSGSVSSLGAEALTVITENLNRSMGVSAQERSRSWVLPPGGGVDIGFGEDTLPLISKITAEISTSSMAFGLIWDALGEVFDDAGALTAVEMGIAGVCFTDAYNSTVSAAEGSRVAAGIANIATCAMERAPDIVGEIAGNVSEQTWGKLGGEMKLPQKIARVFKSLVRVVALGKYTVVIGDAISTLMLVEGAKEITLHTKLKATPQSVCGDPAKDVRKIKHPKLGTVEVALVATGKGSLSDGGCIAVFDDDGKVLLVEKVSVYGDALDFAEPETDATSNVFINYNPGRYNGVITLVPNDTGYHPIGWDSDLAYQNTRHAYYYAELVGPGSDGRYEIEAFDNDCEPDCAGGTITSEILRWNGTDYS